MKENSKEKKRTDFDTPCSIEKHIIGFDVTVDDMLAM
jgi:hypothetical protein